MAETQSKKKQHKGALKYIIPFWGILALPILGLAILFMLIASGKMGFMPTFEDLENPDNNVASQVYTEDNVLLGNYYIQLRTYINFDDLSPNIVNALIATEDYRFEKHAGIDGIALARVFYGLMTGSNKGGGSTITQQLAKNLFPRDTTRYNSKLSYYTNIGLTKFKEWVTAVKLEKNYTKEEILVMYLNTVYFGNHSFGIKSAAKTFFNTTPKNLTINEAATLVGVLKAPSYYSPIQNPERAQQRRNVVLNQMRKYEFISEKSYDTLSNKPLELSFEVQDHNVGMGTYVREYLRLKLNKPNPFEQNYQNSERFKSDSASWVDDPVYGWCNKNFKPDGEPYNLYTDGLKIYSTINSKIQRYAEEAVWEHMSKDLQLAFFEEKKHNRKGPFSDDLDHEQIKSIMKQSMKRCTRYGNMRSRNVSSKEIEKVFNTPTKMRVFTLNGEVDTTMTPMDSIWYYKHFLQSGFMAADPKNGHVKAYVGGIDFKHFKYDHISGGRRQVGSTFKPFLYTLAMQEGYSPCYKVPNVPVTITLPTGETWTPESVGPDRFKRKTVTLKTGLAHSINNISAWLMQQFKPKAVIDIVRLMGVESPIPEVPSIALGSADLSLFEMVSAYTTYANKGIHTSPIFITRIEDKNGNILEEFKAQKNEAISENAAYLMINLLQAVVNEGTSIRLRYKYELEGEIGGKTGTTNNQSDGWFMGIVPKMVAGVWTGGEERSIHFDGISLGQGANMALPIYGLFMQKVHADSTLNISPKDTFPEPENFYMKLDCKTEGSQTEEHGKDFDDEFFN
ncbi:MAG: transglycosylase domain-containing protein [Salinivirgaceae bacterium]